jgi:hypothetical protein
MGSSEALAERDEVKTPEMFLEQRLDNLHGQQT